MDKSNRKSKKKFVVSNSAYGKIRSENRLLLEDYIEHMKSIGRSDGTILTYNNNILIFLVWNMRYNNNIRILNVKKHHYIEFQEYTKSKYNWSDNRSRIVQMSVSSFIDYLISTDKFPGAENCIKKIPIGKPKPVKKIPTLTQRDISAILNSLVKREMYLEACVVALIISSGRLPGDLSQFKCDWFNKDNIVSGSLYYTPEPIRISHGAKNSLEHVYIYKPTFEKYFDLWMRYRNENNINSKWLFPIRIKRRDDYICSGKPLKAGAITAIIYKINNLHIIQKRVNARSLSNYFGDHMRFKNVPDEVITEITKWRPGKAEEHYKHHAKEFITNKYFNENGVKEIAKKPDKKIDTTNM